MTGSSIILARSAERRSEIFVPQPAVFEDARLSRIVDVLEPEALAIAQRPFKIIQQRPDEIPADIDTALDGIRDRAYVRLDVCPPAFVPNSAVNHLVPIVQVSKPYLYASRRYRVPFGWYANPIPSTASTAWVIIVADDFDPFEYGGGLLLRIR
jgi:hypothetical protein